MNITFSIYNKDLMGKAESLIESMSVAECDTPTEDTIGSVPPTTSTSGPAMQSMPECDLYQLTWRDVLSAFASSCTTLRSKYYKIGKFGDNFVDWGIQYMPVDDKTGVFKDAEVWFDDYSMVIYGTPCVMALKAGGFAKYVFKSLTSFNLPSMDLNTWRYMKSYDSGLELSIALNDSLHINLDEKIKTDSTISLLCSATSFAGLRGDVSVSAYPYMSWFNSFLREARINLDLVLATKLKKLYSISPDHE